MADEERLDEPGWRRRVTETPWVLARAAGVPVGVVAAVPEDLHPGQQRLIAMWVDPGHRGGPVAGLLVEVLCDWARTASATGVSLWVTQDNARARGLYERLGFVATGEREPMVGAPDVTVERMQRPL
nr:GNAT family N-acetyltransferase [Motilibacter deserti]